MKHIQDPGPIKFVNLLGQQMREPVVGPDGEPLLENGKPKLKAATGTLKQFSLGLLAAPEFIGELKGIDAAALVLSARQAIAGWDDAPGPKLLEDEHHRGLVRAVKETKFDQAIAHNLVPFMQAIVDAKTAPDSALAQPKAKKK